MTFKLNKIAKKGIAIGLAAILLLGASGCSLSPNNTSSKPSTSTTITINNDYINTLKTNEFRVYDEDRNTTNITLSNVNYMKFLDLLNGQNYEFRYDDYYGLDEALQLYNENKTTKETTSTLLTDGKLDAAKLMKKVQENNTEYMSQGKTSINSFYSDMGASDMTMICNTIAEVINKECSPTQISQVANTLMKLTMFIRTGSASNAYITNNLTFVYNPNMSSLYADMQELQGKNTNETETLKQVIIHEVMHLIQYSASDSKDANGLEAGICRMYNLPNSEKRLGVDSLWNSWLLEAAAELKMADYMNIEPGTYAKRISYARSYNLSRFNELDLGTQKIEDVVFDHSLEEAYQNLELKTPEEQREFLNFLYSIELIQMDPEDFWEHYTEKTGITPTDSEKLAIRMDIRTDAVKYMTRSFYNNLADAIKEGKVADLDTAFYLIRNWELDVYGHLEYTKTSSLEHAKDFIIWHDQIQNGLFSALAESNGLTTENIITQYDEYNLQANVNNQIYDNCNLGNYPTVTSEYITTTKNNYTTSNFSKNNAVYEYIQAEQITTQTTNSNEHTK